MSTVYTAPGFSKYQYVYDFVAHVYSVETSEFCEITFTNLGGVTYSVYGYTSTQQTTQRALLNERSVLVYVLGPTRAHSRASATLAPWISFSKQSVDG